MRSSTRGKLQFMFSKTHKLVNWAKKNENDIESGSMESESLITEEKNCVSYNNEI